jgi:hypothetical protein
LIAKREGGKKETNLSLLFVAAIGGLQNSAHFLTGQKHRRKKKRKKLSVSALCVFSGICAIERKKKIDCFLSGNLVNQDLLVSSKELH